MSERANPNDPEFKNSFKFLLRRGFFPWIEFRENPYRKALIWRYQWIKAFCQNKDVLDVPCGMGWGTSMIKGTRSLTGLDISCDAVKEANEKYGKLANFIVGSMEHLKFEDASLDIVVCIEGIEHVPKEIAVKFIREASRVLRHRGKLFISSPYCKDGSHSGNEFHIHEYQPDEIKHLICSEFNILDIVTREVDNLTVDYIHAEKTIYKNE